MPNKLEKSILATIVYFDIFEYPLTVFEIWSFLLCHKSEENLKFSLMEVRDTLFGSKFFSKIIRQKYGYWHLRGREQNIETRRNRYITAKRKYNRALRFLRVLSRLPFVRSVFICNSLAYSNARDQSDIDIFLAVSKGGAWWARFFSLALLSLFRARPKKNKKRDTICASFIVDEENLNIEVFKNSNHDIYLAYWVATLFPLSGSKKFFEKFWSKNLWVKNYLPNSVFSSGSVFRKLKGPLRFVLFFEFFLKFFNFFPKILQKAIFPNDIKNMANKDSRVVISDGALKFHTNDRRAFYTQKFIETYNEIYSIAK
jgi:hypothetical protein